MDKFKIILNNKLDTLPKTAGVYCFKSIAGSDPAILYPAILYIGKAINIQNRVKNHFQQPSYKDDLYIQKVNKIGYLETNSEIEALILEANLIKKYQPKFNVVWRDDKNYFYVAITKDEKPFIYITHQKNEKTEYIGPFVEGTALKKALRFLRRVFPYYTIKKHSKNKCTYCHLDLCPGPNPNLIEYKKKYQKTHFDTPRQKKCCFKFS
jgi:excinuclease ABC subunit C